MTGVHPAPDGPRTDQFEDESARLVGLIRYSARGDEAAFARLYEATSARMHGLVLQVVRDPAQAEEVTQEVFAEIWRQCARYDQLAGSPLAWMMTIGHRRAVDRVRSDETSVRWGSAYERRNREIDHDQTTATATTTDGLSSRGTSLSARTVASRLRACARPPHCSAGFTSCRLPPGCVSGCRPGSGRSGRYRALTGPRSWPGAGPAGCWRPRLRFSSSDWARS